MSVREIKTTHIQPKFSLEEKQMLPKRATRKMVLSGRPVNVTTRWVNK